MSSESDSEFLSADEEELNISKEEPCRTSTKCTADTQTCSQKSEEKQPSQTTKEYVSAVIEPQTVVENKEENVEPLSSVAVSKQSDTKEYVSAVIEPQTVVENKAKNVEPLSSYAVSQQSDTSTRPGEVSSSSPSQQQDTIDTSTNVTAIHPKKLQKDVEERSLEPNESTDLKTTNDAEPQNQKQRVMLRLEKKKIEKAESKECPREKPSDLINLLEDLNSQKQQSSWGFSSWGSSILSTAASSVSTFSNQVSQGLGAVLETVESTLGAPSPEELASDLRQQKDASTESSENVTSREESASGIIPDIAGWTKVLENTSSKMIMGGLDTLELIGKKTMDILTEGDPGLRKKRSAFEGVNLSEILREAKSKADEADKDNSEDDKLHYSQIFDEKQGLVHLEALEILSQESQVKLQRLLMRHSRNQEVKKRLEEIKVICENIPSLDDSTDCENFDDFETVFRKHCSEIILPLNPDNIVKVQRLINESLSEYENDKENQYCPKDIFQAAINSLAEFTAKCIETFHKVAELTLVQSDIRRELELCATNLTGLTTVMCIEVNIMSTRYHKCLDSAAEKLEEHNSDNSTMAVNLYVEAANSNKYIQDAFKMLVPLLQTRLLETIE